MFGVSVRWTPPVCLSDVQLGWLSGVAPGEQLVDTSDFVVGDPYAQSEELAMVA